MTIHIATIEIIARKWSILYFKKCVSELRIINKLYYTKKSALYSDILLHIIQKD